MLSVDSLPLPRATSLQPALLRTTAPLPSAPTSSSTYLPTGAASRAATAASESAVEVKPIPERKKLGLVARRRILPGEHFFQEVPNILTPSRAAGDPEAEPISHFGKTTTIHHTNHSCRPNAEVHLSFEPSPLGIMKATRPIAAGAEITIDYLPDGAKIALPERRRRLRDTFYIICRCERCAHEGRQERLEEQRVWNQFLWEAPLRGAPSYPVVASLKTSATRGSRGSLWEHFSPPSPSVHGPVVGDASDHVRGWRSG